MNRYDEFDELDAPKVNPAISTNIYQLRIEKRLSQKDLAKEASIDVDDIIAFEKGLKVPTENQVKALIKILRISYYDMMTRDILKERNETTEKMKKSKERSNYNWYYGSRTKVLLDIIYLASVPLAFLIGYIIAGVIQNKVNIMYEVPLITNFYKFLIAYIFPSLITGIILTINIIKKYNIQFQLWYIFWITTLCWLILALGALATIPYYIYIAVNLIIKKGKNHL